MKRLFLSIIVISLVAASSIGLSVALFSDSETSTGNTFQAGALDLKIDNTSYYNGVLNPETTWLLDDLDGHLFFNFSDIKPGDWGEDTVSLHVHDNDAWACVDITLTKNDDNGCTDSELVDDSDCDLGDDFDGDLAQEVEFIFWNDDGDNVLEEEENILGQGPAIDILNGATWTLADSTINNLGGAVGEPLKGLTSYYIGKAWCFGTLTPNPLPQTDANSPEIDPGVICNGQALGNASQTDLLMGDIEFRAVQYRNNPDFLCQEEECFEVAYTASVISYDQGTLKNGNPITDPNRTDPIKANGEPDWVVGTGTNFYSLGKNTSGSEGWVILAFSSIVKDGPGDDLSIHEATNGRNTYPAESAKVEISLNGTDWYEVGTATSEPGGGGDGVSWFDISATGLSTFKYVRITDVTNFTPHANDADGFDLDAVDAVYGPCE